MGEDHSALRLCVLFQMTLPGAPCIYYGDEIGLSAAQDPFCRAAFPWQDQGQWDHHLLAFYRRAIAMRHHTPALRTGAFQRLHTGAGIYAFARTLPGQHTVVIVNTETRAITVDVDVTELVPSETILEDVWNDGQHVVTQQRLHGVNIPAWDAVVLVRVEDGPVR